MAKIPKKDRLNILEQGKSSTVFLPICILILLFIFVFGQDLFILYRIALVILMIGLVFYVVLESPKNPRQNGFYRITAFIRFTIAKIRYKRRKRGA